MKNIFSLAGGGVASCTEVGAIFNNSNIVYAMTGLVADAGTVRETIETVTGICSIIPAVTGEIHPKS